ncbi:MAG: hypothetical protein WC831_03315 [Parcubacteria group bacterium]|jgi:hypothetical protein
MKIKGFLEIANLPPIDRIGEILQSSAIRKVIHFCLGPDGTNIHQAAEAWSLERGLSEKAEIKFCETPEVCLTECRQLNGKNILGFFWTCAVYFKLHELFFTNRDCLPFFVNFTMALDTMQLATRVEKVKEINGCIPVGWKIASHPSPAPLLNGHRRIMLVDSNSAAAKACSEGMADGCITTESARLIHGLEKIGEYGSPQMVFFAGITEAGARLVANAYQLLQ